MNINEVHWNFSDNGTKEPAKSRFWNFYNFWTAWNFLMRFSLLCSGEWALSFYLWVFIYIGVSLKGWELSELHLTKVITYHPICWQRVRITKARHQRILVLYKGWTLAKTLRVILFKRIPTTWIGAVRIKGILDSKSHFFGWRLKWI